MAIEALSDIQRAGTSAFVGGGGAQQTPVNFTQAYRGTVTITVSIPGMVAGSIVAASLIATEDEENDAESLADDNVMVFATAITDAVRFTFTSEGWICGPYRIKYEVI